MVVSEIDRSYYLLASGYGALCSGIKVDVVRHAVALRQSEAAKQTRRCPHAHGNDLDRDEWGGHHLQQPDRSAAYIVEVARVGKDHALMPDIRYVVPSGKPAKAAALIPG